MGYGWLNLGSLVLGILAWVIPVVCLVLRKREAPQIGLAGVLTSMTACGAALCMQVYYTNHLVELQDWSALMDTARAVCTAASVLTVVAVALNIGVLISYGRKQKR